MGGMPRGAENISVATIEMMEELEGWTRYSSPRVMTIYKRKQDKIRPLDRPTNGEAPGGDPQFFLKCEEKEIKEGRRVKKGEFDQWIMPKFSDVKKGSRLTLWGRREFFVDI
jgi:hypothetical protein